MSTLSRTTVLILFLLALVLSASAQIETTIFNGDVKASPQKAIFFTNRPLEVRADNSYTFRNKFTDQSNTLYFCGYRFDTDSIEIYYRTINFSDSYPREKMQYNIFYDIYNYHRLERGIKNFYIIVGGYGKSFEKQVHSYMRRLMTNYGDTLFDRALISVFAWGTEDDTYQYYNAVRESKKGAADFAIFQHMLDEFMTDSLFFRDKPRDFHLTILFSSMGNNLFKEYLEERESQGIPLVKTYNRISFVGSVAPRNSFNEGKAFHNINQMTDTVDVFVNSKDILLKMSSAAHLRSRMGNRGPLREDKLPGYIKVYHLDKIITMQDMAKLGHDYLLTNSVLRDAILEGITDDRVVDQREK